MADKCLHIIVTGTVQGVGYRYFVQGLAAELVLTGWVRNARNGVEIKAEGNETVLKEFLDRLQSDAPRGARVTGLESNDVAPLNVSKFSIVDTV